MRAFQGNVWYSVVIALATTLIPIAASEYPASNTVTRQHDRGISPRHKPRIAPHLRGFGTTTVAGSGRHRSPPRTTLFTISTLAESGPGSLRSCIEYSQPRTCIFQVAGVIPIRKVLRIKSPYITIAGQTAPAPGITITGGGLSIETHDVFVHYCTNHKCQCAVPALRTCRCFMPVGKLVDMQGIHFLHGT
jgi:hypothetical protein